MTATLPLPVARSLKRLGANISKARRRREVDQATFAALMGISLASLKRLEAGRPGIGLHTFVRALQGPDRSEHDPQRTRQLGNTRRGDDQRAADQCPRQARSEREPGTADQVEREVAADTAAHRPEHCQREHRAQESAHAVTGAEIMATTAKPRMAPIQASIFER